MKHTVLIDNKKVTGTSEEIVNKMRKQNFFNSNQSLSEFIQTVQHRIWSLFGVGITIPQNLSVGNKCSLLIEQLISTGFLIDATSINISFKKL